MRALFLLLLTPTLHAQPGIAVVEKIAGKLAFYSSTGERTSEVKIGTYPHEIVRSLDGKSLFVTDNGILWMQNAGKGGNTISIIDVATRKKPLSSTSVNTAVPTAWQFNRRQAI